MVVHAAADVQHREHQCYPKYRFVIVHGRHQPQDGLNDRPRGLHAVLPGEEGAVAYHGVAQETLIISSPCGWSTTLSSVGSPINCSPGRLTRAPMAIVTSGLSRK